MNAAEPIWTPAREALWQRIRTHTIGAGGARVDFVARLAKEQGYGRADAEAALEEYRRFVFLAVAAGHLVTPSEEVDAVWHLHLTETRDYWQRFCPQVLGTELHHEPSRGGGVEQQRYREAYAETLASYARYFGTPPRRWWPDARTRFAPPRWQRIEAGRYWLLPRPRGPWLRWRGVAAMAVLALLPALAAAALPDNPLDWPGPAFLKLYAGLLVGVLLGSLLLRARLKAGAEPTARSIGALSPWEVAYLAGREARAFDAAVAELHQRGRVSWDAGSQRLLFNGDRSGLEPPLDKVAEAIASHGRPNHALLRAARQLRGLRDNLARRGLWFEAAVAKRIATLSALPLLALTAFGVAKIAVGISRDKPVALLVILTALCAVLCLVFYLKRPQVSRAGRAELIRLRQRHDVTLRAHRSADVALAVALGGTAVLAGTGLGAFHEARATAVSSDSGGSSTSSTGSSCSSSDSGGSSGCGGCGGGGGD